MSVLTCPRCRAEAPVAEGSAPVCPCGYGARTAEEPPVRAAAPPPPAGPVPHASSGRWKIPALVAALLVVAAVAAVIVFAGGDPEARVLSQEEAQEVAGLAMRDLQTDMESPGGGDIRLFSGAFSFEDGDLGAGSADIEMEWGRGDASRFLMSIRSGPTTISIEVFCFPDRNVMVFGENVYESRPQNGSCMDFMSDDSTEEFSPIDLDADMQGLEVTPHGDGTVTATFSDEDGNYTLHVDAQGRATRMEVSSPDGEGAFDVSYGARKAITAPEATSRAPSSVGGFCFLGGGSCTYQATGGDDAPLSEFEVRVYAEGATPDDDPSAQPVARFALDGGPQDADGFTFALTEDGDGLFGDGDSFRLTAPGDDYEVVVWDLWADRDVQDNPAPGLAPLWAGLALLVAALVARRR